MLAAVYNINQPKLAVLWIPEIQVADMDIEVEYNILPMEILCNLMLRGWKHNQTWTRERPRVLMDNFQMAHQVVLMLEQVLDNRKLEEIINNHLFLWIAVVWPFKA